MQVKIKDGKLVIEIEMEKVPRVSKSGSTRIVASTGGFKATTAEIDGQPVSISINATIPKAA